MWLLRAVLDRIVLLVAVFCAGSLPGFITQYRQRLSGRLEQVTQDLAPYQAIADQQHHGSLQELVQYHLHSTDPTFHQEGDALQSMVQAAERLRSMVQALNTDIWHQIGYLSTHSDSGLMHATWSQYHPAFAFDVDDMLFALIAGTALWAVFMLLWLAASAILRRSAGVTAAASPGPR